MGEGGKVRLRVGDRLCDKVFVCGLWMALALALGVCGLWVMYV